MLWWLNDGSNGVKSFVPGLNFVPIDADDKGFDLIWGQAKVLQLITIFKGGGGQAKVLQYYNFWGRGQSGDCSI